MTKAEWLFTLIVVAVLSITLAVMSKNAEEDIPPSLPEPVVTYSSEPTEPDRVFE